MHYSPCGPRQGLISYWIRERALRPSAWPPNIQLIMGLPGRGGARVKENRHNLYSNSSGTARDKETGTDCVLSAGNDGLQTDPGYSGVIRRYGKIKRFVLDVKASSFVRVRFTQYWGNPTLTEEKTLLMNMRHVTILKAQIPLWLV